MSTFLDDLCYSTRRLARARGFTLTVVLLLACAFAANAGIFSLVYGVLYKPLPSAFGEDLKNIDVYFVAERSESGLSAPILTAMERQAKTLSAIAGYLPSKAALNNGPDAEPTPLQAVLVEPRLFGILGLRPAAGRLLDDADAVPKNPGVLVSWRFAREHFGSAGNALDKSLTFMARTGHIVGVMPADVHFASSAQVWMPLAFTAEDLQPQAASWFDGLRAVARLAPNVTVSDAEQELALLTRQQLGAKEVFASLAGDSTVHVTSVRHVWAQGRETVLVIMLLTALLIMLATATNVCNLYIARVVLRQHEAAMFAALGASAARRRRLAYLEIVLLVGAAGAIGLALMPASIAILGHFDLLLKDTPYPIAVDGATLAFVGALAVATALAMGLCTSSLRRAEQNIHEVFKQSGAGRHTSGVRTQRLRLVLTIGQVALTTVLLTGTGLLIRSAHRLLAEDIGFDRNNLLVSNLNMQADPATYFATVAAVRDRIAALPGVDAVGLTDAAPFSHLYALISYVPPGTADEPGARRDANVYSSVDAGYFDALKQPILLGRAFTSDEARLKAPVVIVDADFARRYFPESSPIGSTIEVKNPQGGPQEPPRRVTIVGVANTIKFDTLDQAVVRPTLYLPGLEGAQLIIRTKIDPAFVASSLKSIAREIAPKARIGFVALMHDWIENSMRDRIRLNQLLELLGLIALCLATVGLYAVLAYSVRTRLFEFGVRIALGATTGRIQRSVLRQGLIVIGFGLLIGLPAAYGVAQLLGAQLYRISPADPMTLVGVAMLVASAGLVASCRPARTAGRTDPAGVLRAE